MPAFDPTLPAQGSPLSSAVMRSQLTSLKALIDAILTVTSATVESTSTLNPGDPATAGVVVDGNTLRFTFGIPRGETGPQGNPGSDGGPGPEGPQGPPFANAVVTSVSTLPPGDSATVNVTFDGTTVGFTFGIPRGETGPQGNPGSDGGPGPVGPQGPPFANAVVDGVTTLAPGDPATVTTGFDGTNVRFSFGIPQGLPGAAGAQGPPFATAVVDGVTTLAPGDPAAVGVSFDGTYVRFTFAIPQGAPGSEGPPGPAGEVSQAALEAAIATTALNPTSVSPLASTADASYNPAQMQSVMDKLDELRAALTRL